MDSNSPSTKSLLLDDAAYVSMHLVLAMSAVMSAVVLLHFIFRLAP